MQYLSSMANYDSHFHVIDNNHARLKCLFTATVFNSFWKVILIPQSTRFTTYPTRSHIFQLTLFCPGSVFIRLSFTPFLVHYSYGCNIRAHDDELWSPLPERYSRKKGENSSLLRDSFSCHILLCPPTATNTISLNNLVFMGKNVPGSALFIFAYQPDVCDEKNNSLCVLEEKKLGRLSVYLNF